MNKLFTKLLSSPNSSIFKQEELFYKRKSNRSVWSTLWHHLI